MEGLDKIPDSVTAYYLNRAGFETSDPRVLRCKITIMSFDSLRDLFIEVQDSKNQHQMIQAFYQLFSSTPFDIFMEDFLQLIKYPMVVYQREQAVEKTIEFIAKAVAHLAKRINEGKSAKELDKSTRETDNCMKESDKGAKESDGEKTNNDNETLSDEDEEEMHPLLMKLFEFLLEVHSAKEKGVRFRVCQLISRLLTNLGEGAQIDDSLYDDIYKCMLERLRDKCPAVRVHAVLALSRLQNPSDESCPISKAYMILVSRDPNVEVRRIVLTCLVPSVTSLPVILDRTRDVKDTVRTTAYSVIAERVPFRALKIEQRIQLLQDGLNDRSETVRTAFSNKVLQAWLISCEGNVLELLKRLDVQSCVKTCEKAIVNMMKNSGILDLIQKFDVINEKAMIDSDKLNCESSFYWSRLIKFVIDAGHNYDEQLDLIRPNCVEFCAYIEDFTKKLAACTDEDEMMDLEFIMEQLLLILSFMDVSDQASRKVMQTLLYNLLVWDSVWPSLMVHIMPCLKLIYREINELATFLVETISEIREPISKVEKGLNKSEQRDLDVKIAGIKIKIHQMREELDSCIQAEDYEKAAQLKANICELDSEKSILTEKVKPKMEEVRTQRDDPLTLLKCLTLVCEFLSLSKVKTMTPTLQTLMENEVLPGMTNEVTEIRNHALKAIGLCCLIDKSIIFQHLPLLLQASQIDTQVVRITALKSIFDLIHVHGLDAFKDSTKDESVNTDMEKSGVSEVEENRAEADLSTADLYEETQNESNKDLTEMAHKLITLLSAALDNENPDIRIVAVEGFSKLLLSGRLVSSNLLSHLLLLWFNPLSEDDPSLLQTLAAFFPLFAFSNSSNQQLVEETFLPTLRTILRAPSSSPLAEVNELNVAKFLCRLTDAQHLIGNQNSQNPITENPYHDSLTVKLCNEILSSPDSFQVKFWLKVLGQLFITPDNITLLRDLITLLNKMSTTVTEKQCVKLIYDLSQNTSDMLQEAVNSKESDNTGDNAREPDGATVNKTPEQRASGESEENIFPTKTPSNGKTPANTRSTRASKARSNARSTRCNSNFSQLDDNVFATPAQRKARHAEGLEETRVNLENLLLETSSKTPKKSGKTPKRPLHNIQDPSFAS